MYIPCSGVAELFFFEKNYSVVSPRGGATFSWARAGRSLWRFGQEPRTKRRRPRYISRGSGGPPHSPASVIDIIEIKHEGGNGCGTLAFL